MEAERRCEKARNVHTCGKQPEISNRAELPSILFGDLLCLRIME
jgi:hypothetical protein